MRLDTPDIAAAQATVELVNVCRHGLHGGHSHSQLVHLVEGSQQTRWLRPSLMQATAGKQVSPTMTRARGMEGQPRRLASNVHPSFKIVCRVSGVGKECTSLTRLILELWKLGEEAAIQIADSALVAVNEQAEDDSIAGVLALSPPVESGTCACTAP